MQHLAPPQYSPDGRWWWNGRAWVRVTWPVQSWSGPGVEEPVSKDVGRRRRSPAVLWVGLIALLGLLLLAFGAPILGWLSAQAPALGGLRNPAAPATAPPAQPEPTPAPTSRPSAIDAYRQLVTADAGRFQVAGQAVADRCAPGALQQGTADCRAALQGMDDSVQRFQSDLAATPVPACLQPADGELRTALARYHQGIQQELSGIDHQDVAAITQGAAAIGDATSHAQSAASLLQSSC